MEGSALRLTACFSFECVCMCRAPPEGLTKHDCVLFTLTSSTVRCRLSLRGEISLWRGLLDMLEDRAEAAGSSPLTTAAKRTSFSLKESQG